MGACSYRGCLSLVTATLVACPTARAGQATCSNPALPIGGLASSELMPGRLTLDLTTGFVPSRGKEVLATPQGSVLYDTRFLRVESQLSAEYVLRPWLAIAGSLPYRVDDINVRYLDPDTGLVIPQATSIHVRTETLHGFGDASLGIHLERDLDAFRLRARFGSSLPLGRIESDPYLLGSLGQEHEHVQFGTGTFIPHAGIEVQHTIGSQVMVAGWGLMHLSLYDNARRYRAGDRFSGGLSASSGFGRRSWTFGLAIEGHGETAEKWQGTTYRMEGNAGRFDVLAGGSVSWRPLHQLAMFADIKYAIHSWIAGTQLGYDVVANIGISVTFDRARRSSWRGLDHDVVGSAGSAPDLVPVPGQITVFDLWAAWCAPCRELDDRLAALARAHPEKLAVRKLDVIDPESAAWRRLLAPNHFGLPHLKVFGADGRLIFERTAPPAALVRALEELLR